MQPGTQLGRYEIQRRLGQGGMGTLYLARDPLLERLVAVKLFLGDLDVKDARARFTQEARAVASLNHSNIVTVYDYGELQSQPYIVMEYIEGETVADLIRGKTSIRVAEKLRWIEELCAGVAYAHQIGIIHRDIKPANLMIDGTRRLKVLDFGIARMRGALASSATALIGTPGYMAPEQIRGGTIDHRSDLFSIGVVAYELLSYAEAFPGDTMHAITRRMEAEPVPIVDVVPDLDAGLVRIIERALQKDARARFQDADELRIAVANVRQHLEGGPESVTGPATGNRVLRASGAGDSRRTEERSQEAIGVSALTPPPGHRRTDREALVRRRSAQIDAALTQARALLEAGSLEAAQTACEQVLTLDETNTPAVELYRNIERSFARRGASALLTRARREMERGALAVAADLLQRARALDPTADDAGKLETDLRLARVEHGRTRKRAEEIEREIWSSQRALAAGELDLALRHVRKAFALDPGNDRALRLEREVLLRLDGAVTGAKVGTPGDAEPTSVSPANVESETSSTTAGPTVITRRGAAPPAPLRPTPANRVSQPAGGTLASFDVHATSRRAAEAAMTWIRWPSRQKHRAISVALIAFVILGATAWLALDRLVAPAQGTVIIDAIPWGIVTEITAEDGSSPQPLPEIASTPLVLHLAAGRYRVSITGPPPDSTSRVIDVRVEPGGVTSAPMQLFQPVTVEEYFDKYLSPSPARTESTP